MIVFAGDHLALIDWRRFSTTILQLVPLLPITPIFCVRLCA